MSEQQQKFEWDFDMPDDPFWQSVGFKISRNVHKCFDEKEISQMKLNSDLSYEDKLQLLLDICREKLIARQAAASPKELYQVDYTIWHRLGVATSGICQALDRKDEAHAILKEMALTPDLDGEYDVSSLHNLAFATADRGEYAEAESIATKLLPLEHAYPKLGEHSPQAINLQRLLVRVCHKQGKTDLARTGFAHLTKLTDEVKSTRFRKYEAEEREQNTELVEELGIQGWVFR